MTPTELPGGSPSDHPGSDHPGVVPCLFVSDLHGQPRRYDRLIELVGDEAPSAVFLGGDLLPGPLLAGREGQAWTMLQTTRTRLAALKRDLGHRYPSIFVIPGNDDGGLLEEALLEGEREGIWRYAHGRISDLDGWSRIEHCDRPSVSPAAQRRGEPQDCARLYTVLGYACVPPTPFLLKDWERYDVSRYLGPVDVSPEDGIHLIPFDPEAVRYGTMENDLERLAVQVPDFRRMVCLFHAPPSDCDLDRAALDGRVVDHVPLDLHVGSLAIRRFIESRQPLVSLHGHIHEAPRLTGAWCVKIGRTLAFTAAHDGPELAVIRFDLADPQRAERALV